MKKIFLLTALYITVCSCDNKDYYERKGPVHPPINSFFIRLVDKEGNWIEGIEEKEMQLFVTDSNWNILDPQPDSEVYLSHLDNPIFWAIQKHYN